MTEENNHPVLGFVAKVSDMPIKEVASLWEKFIGKAHDADLDLDETEKLFFKARKKAKGKNKGIMDLLWAGYIGYWFGIDTHAYAMEREEARRDEPSALVSYFGWDGEILE